MINGDILTQSAPTVFALLTAGESATAIATRFGVSRQAVHQFKARHATEIQQRQQAALDYAIMVKGNRIADAQLRRDLLDQVRRLRAAGDSGVETGIVLTTYKSIGAGENAQVMEEHRVDTAMLREWRENDRQVAEELGEMPRAGVQAESIQVNISLRWADGTEA